MESNLKIGGVFGDSITPYDVYDGFKVGLRDVYKTGLGSTIRQGLSGTYNEIKENPVGIVGEFGRGATFGGNVFKTVGTALEVAGQPEGELFKQIGKGAVSSGRILRRTEKTYRRNKDKQSTIDSNINAIQKYKKNSDILLSI